MRRVALLVALALLGACGRGGDGPSRAVGDDVKPFVPQGTASGLEDFLPPRLGGGGRQVLPDYMKVPEGDAHAAYLVGDGTALKTINLNLHRVAPADPPGEAGERFVVHGHEVTRVATPEAHRTQARALVGDGAVQVTVTVDAAAEADESVRLIAEVDLDGIGDFARTDGSR
jgi:hypothetical protein